MAKTRTKKAEKGLEAGASSPLIKEDKFKKRKNTKAKTGNDIFLNLVGVSREGLSSSSLAVFTLLPA